MNGEEDNRMRCPRCGAKITIYNYVQAYTDEQWLKEVFCSECQYYDVLEVTEETLEDYVERELQTITKHLKRDILNCNEDFIEEAFSNVVLKHKDCKEIHVRISMYPEEEE